MPNPSLTRVETPQSQCLFAMAWADITPPSNIYHRMWGAAKHERATGVHRPLRATVACFGSLQDTTPSPHSRHCLIALDHCVLGAVEHRQLVSRVARLSGLPEDCLFVVFSHTHGAGLMGLDRATLPGGDLIAGYLESVAETTARLAKDCVARLEPVEIVYGRGQCDLAAHRDFFDGATGHFVCGFTPGVPADDLVLVARVTDRKGSTRAVLVNYACHPTTLAWENTVISPDYIGAMRELVEQHASAPCLFLQGACGELGPKEGFVGDPAVADRNGRQLGFAALSALEALPAPGTFFEYAGPVVSGATLGVWKHQPLSTEALDRRKQWSLHRWHEPLPYRPGRATPAQVETELRTIREAEVAARASGETSRAAELRALGERKHRLLHRLAELPAGETYPLQVALWRVGGAFWLGVQGESYNVLQTELRRRFPNFAIVVASIASDWGASYLPPAALYDQGLYQESIAVVAAGSLEQLIASIAERITAAL